jgi:type III secretion protein S
MNETLYFFKQGLLLAVNLSAVPLLVAMLSGIVVSIFQTLFQLQDQALPFAVKLFAVSFTLAMLGGWIGSEILRVGENAMVTITTVQKR